MKPLIIYGDDNVKDLRLAKEIMQDDGRVEIFAVTTGEGVLYHLAQRPYAAAILDVNLGERLTGTIILKQIKELYPKLPVAVYSNYPPSLVMGFLKSNEVDPATVQIWYKPEVGIDTLADKIIELIS